MGLVIINADIRSAKYGMISKLRDYVTRAREKIRFTFASKYSGIHYNAKAHNGPSDKRIPII